MRPLATTASVSRAAARHLAPPATRCQASKRRLFATTSPACASSPPSPPSSGFTSLPSRQLISISGPDAAKFLHGVITNNVASPDAKPRTQGFYAAFLTAHSRVLFDVFIYPDFLGFGKKGPNGEDPEPGTSFLIEVDTNQVQTLAKHIKRYKLRSKITTRVLEQGEANIWQIWNDAADEAAAPVIDGNVAGPELLKDFRAPGLGYRLVRSGDAAPAVDLEPTNEDSFRIRRYLRGVPEGQSEILYDQALPQESNLDFMSGIDFHKGCYVGQELTIRTKHRGVVRKRVLPCILYEEGEHVPTKLEYEQRDDAAIKAQDIPGESKIEAINKRARGPGKWLAGFGNIGLALCRLEAMTAVPGLPGTTYKEGDEFQVTWGDKTGEEAHEEGGKKQNIKVKALVPEWLQRELDAVAEAQRLSSQQRQQRQEQQESLD